MSNYVIQHPGLPLTIPVGAGGGGGAGFTPTAVKIANYAAQVNDLVRADPTAGGFTVTLPSAAVSGAGAQVAVKVQSDSLNPVAIATVGGDTVDGAPTSVFSLADRRCSYYISDGISDWMLLSDADNRDVLRIADAAVDQFALIKAAATAGRFVMLAAADSPQLVVGVAQTAAAGAASSFINREQQRVPTTLLSDGTTVIAAGDLVQPSQTVAGRVMKGTTNAIATALAAAVAVANTPFSAI